MPYAINADVRIHYQVVGTGPPLVLHHWTFSSLDAWYELGYVDALANEHRLILIDSRGHGRSDAPHDTAAYRPESRVGDVVAVLDALGVGAASFFGYSMGGWIGFCCAKYAPGRFPTFVLGGQHPYAQSMEDARSWLRVGEERGGDAFIDLWQSNVGALLPSQQERMRSFDFTAMIAAAQDRVSLESTLRGIDAPCLLFAGMNDDAYSLADRAAGQIPRGQCVSLPDLDHAETIARCDLVAPLVLEFLKAANA